MIDIPQAPDSPPTVFPPAEADSDPAPASGLGLIGLLLSILGVVSCGFLLFSIPGLIVSIIATRRGRSAKAKAGVVLGGIGVVEFLVVVPLLFAFVLPAAEAARQSARTVKDAEQLAQIHKAMMIFAANDSGGYQPVPGRINRFTHPESPHHEDPWGNQYRIEHGTGGTNEFVVKSDGPDGIPNTEDDQVHPPDPAAR